MRIKITNTHLTDDKSFTILKRVMGQLSDGIWENSTQMRKYWNNLEIVWIVNETGTKTVGIKDYGFPYNTFLKVYDKWHSFKKYGEAEEYYEKYVLNWFANKIKQIIKIEKEDGFKTADWDRHNHNLSNYISSYGESSNIEIADIYQVYDILKRRLG